VPTSGCSGLQELAGSDALPCRICVSNWQVTARWRGLAPPAEDDDPLARRFADLVKQVEWAAERLARDQARAVPLRALVRRAGELLAAAAELDEHRVDELERRWAELDLPASPGLTDTLQQEFAAQGSCCGAVEAAGDTAPAGAGRRKPDKRDGCNAQTG
jgi:hypothetical protein